MKLCEATLVRVRDMVEKPNPWLFHKHNALLSGFSFKMSDGNRRLNNPKFFKEVSSCKIFKKFLKPV